MLPICRGPLKISKQHPSLHTTTLAAMDDSGYSDDYPAPFMPPDGTMKTTGLVDTTLDTDPHLRRLRMIYHVSLMPVANCSCHCCAAIPLASCCRLCRCRAPADVMQYVRNAFLQIDAYSPDTSAQFNTDDDRLLWSCDSSSCMRDMSFEMLQWSLSCQRCMIPGRCVFLRNNRPHALCICTPPALCICTGRTIGCTMCIQ